MFTVFFMSGCYDLGIFKNDEEYYSSFGDVKLINQKGMQTYSFKDYFYNEQSINNFAGDIVEKDEYIYLVLPVVKDFNLAEFSLYLQSDADSVMYYSLYIVDFIPTNIRKYTDPKSTEKKDDDGNAIIGEDGNPVMEDIEYGDLLADDSVYQSSVTLEKNKWRSFTAKLSTKQSQNSSKYHVQNGQYIIVKFENNSGIGFDKGYNSLVFSITNLLIRAI